MWFNCRCINMPLNELIHIMHFCRVWGRVVLQYRQQPTVGYSSLLYNFSPAQRIACDLSWQPTPGIVSSSRPALWTRAMIVINNRPIQANTNLYSYYSCLRYGFKSSMSRLALPAPASPRPPGPFGYMGYKDSKFLLSAVSPIFEQFEKNKRL